MLLAFAIASSVIGLLAASFDALLGGFLSGLASLILIVTGAVRSGPLREERGRRRSVSGASEGDPQG